MSVTTTLTPYQLGELLRRVQPHIGRDSGYAAITGVRLDYDGRHLHAVATDRYTLAAARERVRDISNAPAWALTISAQQWADDVAALLAWTDAHPGGDAVHLTPDTDTGSLTVATARGKLVLRASTGYFPEWRDIIRTALRNLPAESPWSNFEARLLARWNAADGHITTWQPAADKPLVVTSHNFIGLQMPTKLHSDGAQADRWGQWKTSLSETGPERTQDDTLNHWEAAALDEKARLVESHTEDLLKQVLRSTSDLFSGATADTAAFNAYALAGIQSWMAYRLLKAMEKAAPDLLVKTLDDVTQQLESGEIGEWAWDEALAAGFDPWQWRDDYENHLKEQAEKRAKTAADKPVDAA